MSALGQKRKAHIEQMLSAFTPLATFERTFRDVGLVPQADMAKNYSITSSAATSSEPGTVTPNAFAALTLITSSNLMGRSIGKSAGLAP